MGTCEQHQMHAFLRMDLHGSLQYNMSLRDTLIRGQLLTTNVLSSPAMNVHLS